MYQVVKRNGTVVPCDISKIRKAIQKAFDALGKQYTPDIIDLLALRVTADYEPKIKEEKIGVEAIQDSVESVLIQAGYADVAKCYILYRKQHEKIRNIKS
ncbi:MAG TPA: ribonucleoside triphosphate reductase, partial [Ruminococcaceae bacterium]|nr:ribonucleoside triphosphate reductase [Oscillospiraceae bacterium]